MIHFTQIIKFNRLCLVGGIYTVIKSKVPVTIGEYGEDAYFLVGPLRPSKAAMEFEEASCPLPALAMTIALMRNKGINVIFGRWLIEGHPYIILLDIMSSLDRLDEWKGDLWKVAGIPSGINDFEMNDSILFGYLVAWLLGEFNHQLKMTSNRAIELLDLEKKIINLHVEPSSDSISAESKDPLPSRAIIAHFHEWQSGVGLVLLRHRQIDIATLFTTHATLLGRYLCAGDMDFYNTVSQKLNVDEESGKRGIYPKYCLERASAHSAHVFTTVSHITAFEAEHLLKRKPDGVTPNGLNIIKFR